MPNIEYKSLNTHQLGRYGEIYALMEFLSYGIDAYPTEVDDHGVDLVIKDKKDIFHEIQVKVLYKSKYVFFKKEYIAEDDGRFRENYHICLILMKDGLEPQLYLIPTKAWEYNEDKLFVTRSYEYGINIAKKHLPKLEQYLFAKRVKAFLGGQDETC